MADIRIRRTPRTDTHVSCHAWPGRVHHDVNLWKQGDNFWWPIFLGTRANSAAQPKGNTNWLRQLHTAPSMLRASRAGNAYSPSIAGRWSCGRARGSAGFAECGVDRSYLPHCLRDHIVELLHRVSVLPRVARSVVDRRNVIVDMSSCAKSFHRVGGSSWSRPSCSYCSRTNLDEPVN